MFFKFFTKSPTTEDIIHEKFKNFRVIDRSAKRIKENNQVYVMYVTKYLNKSNEIWTSKDFIIDNSSRRFFK